MNGLCSSVGVVKNGSLEWRQMRGRIYSKFHGRKMSELTPTGLHNTVSLFLTLAASTTDTLDVVSVYSKGLFMGLLHQIHVMCVPKLAV